MPRSAQQVFVEMLSFWLVHTMKTVVLSVLIPTALPGPSMVQTLNECYRKGGREEQNTKWLVVLVSMILKIVTLQGIQFFPV